MMRGEPLESASGVFDLPSLVTDLRGLEDNLGSHSLPLVVQGRHRGRIHWSGPALCLCEGLAKRKEATDQEERSQRLLRVQSPGRGLRVGQESDVAVRVSVGLEIAY